MRVEGVQRIIRGHPAKTGRITLTLVKEGARKQVPVDRLVMAAWVRPCPAGCKILHGERGMADNSVGNLSYGYKAGKGRRVSRSDGREFISITEAARDTGIHMTGIWAACNGRAKTAGGYRWWYCDDQYGWCTDVPVYKQW